MSLADDLIAARALIDTPEKWCKGKMSDGKGRYCALGACYADQAAGERVLSAIYEVGVPNSGFLARFNDDPTTTHADVMALFSRAIASAQGTQELP